MLELDVTNAEHLESLAGRVGEHVDRLDGVVHGIAFAPGTAMGGNFLSTSWDDVSTAVHVSTYSLKALALATLPLMKEHGGALVGMDFDASLAWPVYDWMGVAKAGMESAARYLARELGPDNIHCNAVSARALRTLSSSVIKNFGDMLKIADEHAGKLQIAKLNVDENPHTSASFGVQGIPLLVFFRNGVESGRVVGAVPKAQIEAAIRQYLG